MALVRPTDIVIDLVAVQAFLHGLDAVIEIISSHDSKIFVEQGLVQVFDETARLRSPHSGCAEFDFL